MTLPLFAISMGTTARIPLNGRIRAPHITGNLAVEAWDFDAGVLCAAPARICLHCQLLAAAALRHRNGGAELLDTLPVRTVATVLGQSWCMAVAAICIIQLLTRCSANHIDGGASALIFCHIIVITIGCRRHGRASQLK